jgi:hypothetical protein
MTKVTIDPSATKAVSFTAIRDVGVGLGAVLSIVGFLQKGQLDALAAYLRSNAGVAGVGAVLVITIPIWRAFAARANVQLKAYLARHAPDEIAKVKGE